MTKGLPTSTAAAVIPVTAAMPTSSTAVVAP